MNCSWLTAKIRVLAGLTIEPPGPIVNCAVGLKPGGFWFAVASSSTRSTVEEPVLVTEERRVKSSVARAITGWVAEPGTTSGCESTMMPSLPALPRTRRLTDPPSTLSA